ncbi:hypothetical protein ACIRG5_25995 [Lentzea sp. NPDC102401]|uniref:DUF4760 domain-containing protein n=1 Tax=Lentzea sp. NPDC102401 TaxID=3364128 RepID=UPI003825CC06
MSTGPRNYRSRQLRLRWHLAGPLFRLLAQAGVVAVAAVVGFAFLSIGNVINETASVLVAVVFGVATVLQLRQAQRRHYTVGLLMNLQSTLTLSAADLWMAHREIDDEVPAEDMQHVIALLDYYEFLSALAFRGFVEIPLLIDLRGGAMTRCYDLYRSYITKCRAEIGSVLYVGLETFVDEYARHVKHRILTPVAAPPDTLDGAAPTTAG